MIESPKKRFLKSPQAPRLFELSADPALIAGLDYAILQMQWEYGASGNSEGAAALHWQLTGAAKLREILLTLSVVEKPQPKMRGDNLPHEI